MKSKFLLFLASVSLTFLAGQAAAVSGSKYSATRINTGTIAATALTPAAPAVQNTRSARRGGPVFTPEKNIAGEHRYIIQLDAAAVASYRGGVAGYAPTDARLTAVRRSGSGTPRLDTKSPAVQAYQGYLKARQVDFKLSAMRQLGRLIKQDYRYLNSFNGITLSMTQDEAIEVARLPGVVRISRDIAHELTTDKGPVFIGANSLWDGSALEGIGTYGEGVLIGVMDTGINGDHPSFKAVGDDGYVHVNPFGDGVFVGECFATADLPCNNKLVGRYNFTDDSGGSASSEDENGHGSHTASTAAGNVLNGVALPDAEGNPLEFSLGAMSGVAPHANIIAYRVCAPSCFPGDIIAAVDTAIANGVQVLNHSIGSASGSPWNDPKSLSFKGARAAGISMANSAGNGGTDAAGNYVVGDAGATGGGPWSSSVAASSHDRVFPEKDITFGGTPGAPGVISGRAITGGYAGPIVYAGDYANPNDPGGDPAQCLQPFPAGTFNGDEIVLCDRGAIARVQKAINVRDGGAAGFVLCNVDGGAAFLADDPHVIPSIQIPAEDCNPVRDWLASGSGHTAQIGDTGPAFGDPEAGDIMATFSSRGPYEGFDILVPTVSAPGLAIFAAFRDPEQYAFLQGTSMSSPHVAGSMALLHAAHPDWTPAEVHSALVTTGTTDLREDIDPSLFPPGPLRPSDAFDHGGGRVQLQYAAAAGFVLDESDENFDAANPALDGDPRTLNMPYLYDRECLGTCSWTRTVRATRAGTWTFSNVSEDGIATTAEPASFTLAAGDTQEIHFSADVTSLDAEQWVFGHGVFTHDGGAPVQTFPVVARVASAIFPDKIAMTADRDASSGVGGGIRTAETLGLQATAFGLTQPENRLLEITGSVGDFTPYTDNATQIEFYTVPAGSVLMTAKTVASTAPDADLFVGKDINQDREITPDEELCQSGNENSIESCELTAEQLDGGGIFWVAVLNFEGSGDGIVDTTDLEVAIISPAGDGSISAEIPQGVTPGEPFDIRVMWDFPMEIGQTYLGAVSLQSPNGELGVIPVEISRSEDDVKVLASTDSANVGDIVTITVEVSANQSQEDRGYVVDAAIPAGLELIPGSVTGGEQSFVINRNIIWLVDQPSLSLIGRTYQPSINGPNVDPNDPRYDGQCDTGFNGYVNLVDFGFDIDPIIQGNNVVFDILPEQNITLFGGERNGGAHVTDDGFVYFNSQPGPAPGSNTDIPNAAMPNDMAAVLWTDMEVVYDAASNSGVTPAAGGANLSVIEWDNMQRAPAGSSSDSIDFEVIIAGQLDDAAGKYELIYAYDNIIGDWSDATIGVENESGSRGSQYHGPLSDGLMICWDYASQPTDPDVLSFQARVMPSASGSVIEQQVYNIVNIAGTQENVETVALSIAVADSDQDGVTDAADNCAEVANPLQRDTDNDLYGNLCDADFDNDGGVGLPDLHTMIERYQTEDPDADLNGSGFVDYDDIEIFKNLWLRAPGPSGLR